MKANIFLNIIFSIFGMIGCGKTIAQEIRDSKESQEIIIKKKGDKDAKITVEISGNSIMVNGKPLAEFKEDGITINNRKMIIKEGNKITMMFDGQQMPMLENFEGLEDMQVMMNRGNGIGNWDMNSSDSKKVVLGVMTADTKEKEGAVINEVVKEGPAAKIGLQKEDVIYKIDDTKIATSKELSDFIPTKKEGDKVKVYFTRAGKKMDATATLEMRKAIKEVRVMRNGFSNRGMEDMEMPNGGGELKMYKYRNDAIDNAMIDSRNRIKDQLFKISGPKLGIKIQDTELENGVKILDVEKESLSAIAGLQKDDIIIAVADKAVKNTDEAREALNENRKKNSYTMKVKRNDKDVLLTITVPKKLKTANL